MRDFSFTTENSPLPNIGLIVLQTDETIEQDFRRMFPPERANLYVTRIPSGAEVTTDTLAQMALDLPQSASLFPDLEFDAVAYCCTSGTSVIGPAKVAELINTSVKTKHTSNPVSALLHCCETLDVENLAFLSPYIQSVSQILRDVLSEGGIATPYFGSFNESDDATVAKIDGPSISNAAKALTEDSQADALFLSCTNLKTLDLIAPLQTDLNMPILSSNFALAHHISALTGIPITAPSLAK